MIRLSASQLQRLALLSATTAEASKSRQRVPSRFLEAAVQGNEETVAEYLSGVFTRGIEIAGAAEISAAKSPRGLRPLSLMTFPERVLYQALAASLESLMPAMSSRTFDNWSSFHAAPLLEEEVTHIVSADVSSFYQYVDHDLLARELVSQTGDADLAQLVVETLHGVMQRRVGLPQLSAASDFFSEVVIDIAERRMLRKGFRIWRYNDDFRITLSSRTSVSPAIEALDRELRSLGLTLNEEKTFPQTVERYREWFQASDDAWAAVATAVEFDFQNFDPYSDISGEDQDQEGEFSEDQAREAALRALEFWKEQLEVDDLPIRVYRRLLGRALGTMIIVATPEAIPSLDLVLTYEPHVTPVIAAYLTKCVQGGHGVEVVEVLEKWLSDETRYLSAWQLLWLIGPLSTVPIQAVSGDVLTRVRVLMNDTFPDVLRARAGLVVGNHDLASTNELVALYESLHPATQPDVVAAIAIAAGPSDSRTKAVVGESPMNRWIVDWVTEAAEA